MERILTQRVLQDFGAWLAREEKSENTIRKYVRDARAFIAFLDGAAVTKEAVVAYKRSLLAASYAVRSVNSMLASLNSLFGFLGWHECSVKGVRQQRQTYRPAERDLTRAEYIRLVQTAKRSGNRRLALLLETLCGTGIRVSELRYITVEAVEAGSATVGCKGKTRTVFLVEALRKKLRRYAAEQGRSAGEIFVTRTGRPMSRTNIWREMKRLCGAAQVAPQKVFPHNLRHLFAQVYYGLQKDIAKLADLLGHSSIETTRLYLIETGEAHRQQMECMGLILTDRTSRSRRSRRARRPQRGAGQ